MMEGDVIERELPNGICERYTVIDTGYHGPFASFPEHYQAKLRKITAVKSPVPHKTVYNINGPGARVNIGSVDNSTNVVNLSPTELFSHIREALPDDAGESVRSRLNELEAARGTPSALGAYQEFMAAAANHMTVLGPFLPALAQLLS